MSVYSCPAHGEWNAAVASGCPECIRRARTKLKASFSLAAKLCALPEDDKGCISRKAVMDLVYAWRVEIDKP